MVLTPMNGPKVKKDFSWIKDDHYVTPGKWDLPRKEAIPHQMISVIKRIVQSSIWPVVDNDEKVALSGSDMPGYLPAKLQSGTWINIAVAWPVGNQYLVITNTIVDTNDKVGVDAGDTPGFLEDKIVPGTGIVVNVIWSGANKRLEIQNDCCPDTTDELVKVDEDDQCGGYLIDKIKVEDPDGPISLVKQNPNTCEEFLEIQRDPTKAGTVDELVAVGAGKTPGYLNTVVIVDSPIKKQVVGNNLKLSIDANWSGWKRPCARLRVETTFNTGALAQNGNYVVPITQFTEANANLASLIATPNVITCDRDGRWEVGIIGMAEWNNGINAFRVVLVSSGANDRAIDLKLGAGNTAGTYVPWGTWLTMHDRLAYATVSGTTLIPAVAWEQLGVWLLISTQQSENAVDGIVNIVGNDGSWASGPDSGGFTIWAKFSDNLI